MGKRTKDDEVDEEQEVETITVLPGPLTPWRLSLAVGVAAVTTGVSLVHAASSGVGLDMALLRSFGIAFVTWVALGKINSVIGQVETDRLREPAGTRLTAVPDWHQASTSPSTSADHEDSGHSGRAA